MHLREDAGHGDGVIDVWLAALAFLALMGLCAKQIGAIDLTDLLCTEVAFQIDTKVTNEETGPIVQSLLLRW